MRNLIKLGASANLLSGFDPLWFSNNTSTGLFQPEKKPLQEVNTALTARAGEWSFPVITLHDDVEALLSNLFPGEAYNPSVTNEAAFSAGALFLGDNDRATALIKLKDHFGIDFSKSDRGYALVKMIRKDGLLHHASAKQGILSYAHPLQSDPEIGKMADFDRDIKSLRHCTDVSTGLFNPKNLTVEIVNKYLDFFKMYGTHYVSGIEAGDVIYQVFSYEKDKFAIVKAAVAKADLDEENSNLFAYYTTSGGPYGYAAEIGKIACLSKDSTLEESVSAKEWYDPTWTKANSIFAIFNNQSKVNISTLDQKFKAVTAITYQLTSLAIFAELQRRDAWRRIFAGAITQKYPEGSRPNLKQYMRIEDDRLFGSASLSGFTTALATPEINVYKSRYDLADLNFVGGSIVKDFVLTTNLLKVTKTGKFKVPGKTIIINAGIVLAETQGLTMLMMRNATADTTNNLFCNDFWGILCLSYQPEKWITILDGIKLATTTSANKRGEVVAEADIRVAVPALHLPKLKQSLQFAYAFLQSSLHSSAGNAGLKKFVDGGLGWLVKQIPVNSTDLDLLNIRLMALDIVNNSVSGITKTFVPLLPARDYDAAITSIMSLLDTLHQQYETNKIAVGQRITQELVIDIGKTLNDNIISSGKATLAFIETSAANQKAMAQYYQSIAGDQEKKYQQLISTTEMLTDQVKAQQQEVNMAIGVYKSRLDTWVTMAAIKAAFSVIGDIFSAASGGGTKVVEGGKAVEDLNKTVEKIKKILGLLPVLAKVYGTIADTVREVQAANAAMGGVDGAGSLQVSALEWDEMLVNMNTVMANGPDDGEVGEAKESLLGAYKVLVLRGKALLEAKSNAGRLAWEMYNNIKLQEIAADQDEKLKKIKADFNTIDTKTLPDTNLAGLTSNMDFLQNQMLTMLSNAFTIHDQGLQYEYLQPSTPIESFDLWGFKTAEVMQRNNTIAAKAELAKIQPSETEDIQFRMSSVAVKRLTKGNILQIPIGLDATEFNEYVNARVISVVASCSGKVNTPSGKFLMHLQCNADPFMDRDSKRNKRTYHSLPRERTYEYESGTMNPKFRDNGTTWSKDVSQITPFSVWEVSFPNTSLNEGITFDHATVDIILTFKLQARINDAKTRRLSALLFGNEQFKLGDASRPSKESVVSAMYEKGLVTNGWDVVYNMDFAKINQSLKKQFDEVKADAKFNTTIQVSTTTKGRGGKDNITKLTLNLAYSQLEFVHDATTRDALRMKCNISGSIQLCDKSPGQPEECDLPTAFTNKELTAVVPLSLVSGVLKPQATAGKVYTVVLDMASGTFGTNAIDLSPEETLQVNMAIKAHFATNRMQFIINSLDMSLLTTFGDLTPHEFKFKVLVTPSSTKILQLFIQTGERKAMDISQAFLNDMPEPIPAGSSTSLIISSYIFFDKVLKQSVKGGWIMAGEAPDSTRKSWMTKVTSATMSGQLDTSSMDKDVVNFKRKVTLTEDGRKDLNLSLEGMTIKTTSNSGLHLDLVKKKVQDFWVETNSMTCYDYPRSFCKWDGPKKNKYSTDVNVTIGAAMPIVVEGTGKQQSIKIAINGGTVTIDGRMSGGGSCGCDDVQSELNRALKSQLPGKITDALNVSFEPISVFALKNLLFPGVNNVISFQSIYVPADMVIFGGFDD